MTRLAKFNNMNLEINILSEKYNFFLVLNQNIKAPEAGSKWAAVCWLVAGRGSTTTPTSATFFFFLWENLPIYLFLKEGTVCFFQ